MSEFQETTQACDTGAVSQTTVPGVRHFPILLGLEGPLKGRRFVLDKQVVSIGRDMLADIVIKDSKASRHHARIIYVNIQQKDEEPTCRVFDAGSTNGVFINGKRLGPGGACLSDHDRIQVGKTLFGFFIRDDQLVAPEETFEVVGAQDTMSGLLTPRVFTYILSREIERARRYQRHLAVALLRPDNLDQLTSRGGPALKNTILRRIGFLLTQSLRRLDTVARLGPGYEVAFLLPETDKENALRVVQRLCESVAKESFSCPEEQFSVTISIGLAALDWDLDRTEDLVRQAGTALEKARARGGNQAVLFDPDESPDPSIASPPSRLPPTRGDS